MWHPLSFNMFHSVTCLLSHKIVLIYVIGVVLFLFTGSKGGSSGSLNYKAFLD